MSSRDVGGRAMGRRAMATAAGRPAEAGVPQRFRSLPLLLGVLLLLLAGLGVSNQAAFNRHVRLIDEKAELHTLLADLRLQGAWISGPLAVGRWAREQGMIPAPEGRATREVAPEFPPLPRPAKPGGLEVRTVWQ